MTDWPDTLPQRLYLRGANVGLPENRLRSDVDIGPAKVRAVVTLNVRKISGTMRMTTDEWLLLQTFVEETIGSGVSTFNFPDPMNEGQTIEVRFADELPKATATSQGLWSVSINLEEMP